MFNLDSKLVETCTIYPTTPNRYGDLVYGTGVSYPCLYRDISLVNQTDYQENITIDGIFWFRADTVVEKGDVISFSGEYYAVEKVTRAKRLLIFAQNSFIKCEVTRQKQIS